MRRLVRSFFLVVAIGSLFPAVAFAEQIVHLKDGSTLRGEMVSKKDGVVTFKTSIGVIDVPEASIVRIEYSGAAPTATATPAPQTVWDASPATGAAPAATGTGVAAVGAAERPVYLHGKLGYHQYRGSGWNDLGRYKHDFDGPAVEIGGTVRVSQQKNVGIDLAIGGGYYSGSTCVRDEFGDCFDITFTNLYLQAGPRLLVDAAPAVFYGEFALGAYSSSFDVSYRAAGEPAASNSDSRLTPSAHFLLGGGVNATPRVRFFLEGKFVYADGKFPDAAEKLDMGGLLYLAGMSVRIGGT